MPERDSPQREPERQEGEPGYYQAARYQNERPAKKAYEQAQALVFSREDLDLSAYNFHWHEEPHVAVLGVTPPGADQEHIQRILRFGEPTTLPNEVLQVLFERRGQAGQLRPYVEGHWRPGKRLYPPEPPWRAGE